MSKSYVAAKWVGIALCVVSAVWLFFLCLLPGLELLIEARSIMEVCLLIVLGVPGVILFYLSWKLIRGEVTRVSIKNALGMFFGMAIFVAAFSTSVVWIRLGLPDWRSVSFTLSLMLSMVIGLPLYAFFSKRLMAASGYLSVPGEFVGRGSYLIMAWLLWLVLSPVFMELAPRYETESILDLGFLFLPILIPYIL